jgi:hypothetical protein
MEIFWMILMLITLILMIIIIKTKRKKETYLLLILLCFVLAIRLFYKEEYLLSIVWSFNTILWAMMYLKWRKQ